jgi:hypothetical protein
MTLPGKLVTIRHPGVILPGKDALLGSRAEDRLYIQKRQDKQEPARPGMAGQPVFPYTQPRRTDGAVLKIMIRYQRLLYISTTGNHHRNSESKTLAL